MFSLNPFPDPCTFFFYLVCNFLSNNSCLLATIANTSMHPNHIFNLALVLAATGVHNLVLLVLISLHAGVNFLYVITSSLTDHVSVQELEWLLLQLGYFFTSTVLKGGLTLQGKQ